MRLFGGLHPYHHPSLNSWYRMVPTALLSDQMHDGDDGRWYASAPDGLVLHLRQRRGNVNLIRLHLFERVLTASRSGCATVQAFVEQRRQWTSVAPEVVAEVVQSPWFDHWVYLADCCRARLDNGEPIIWDDLPAYREFARLDSQSDPIEWLLRDFGRFSMELALLAGKEMSGIALAWDQVISLGVWGASIDGCGHGVVPWTVLWQDQIQTIELRGERILLDRISHPSRTISGPKISVAPRIVREGLPDTVITDADPLLQREWVRSYVNPDGSTYLPAPSVLDDFRDHYDAGLRLIDQFTPALGHDIAMGLQAIVPVGKPAVDRGVSCSNDTFWGAILCCDNPPILAAEVLIHEFGHNIFNELLARDGVVKRSLSSDEVLYSPWREDPRPVLGLFHATFVFERVCQFYARYSAANPLNEDALYRFRLLLACTRIAARSLQASDAYEPFGVDLIAGIIRRTDQLALLPHARLQSEERLAIAGHFHAWCQRNPQLASSNAFAFPS